MSCVNFLIFLIWIFPFFIIPVIPIKKSLFCGQLQPFSEHNSLNKKSKEMVSSIMAILLRSTFSQSSLTLVVTQVSPNQPFLQLCTITTKNRRKYHIVAFHPYISKCDDQICFYSRRSRRVSKERPKTATLPHPQVLDETLKDKVTLTIALWVKQNKHVFSQGSSPSFHIISI